jgi:hypothetical protein
VDYSIWLAFDHDLTLKLASVREHDGRYHAEALPADQVEVVEP